MHKKQAPKQGFEKQKNSSLTILDINDIKFEVQPF